MHCRSPLLPSPRDTAVMSTSHPVSPMMARRHHTLHPSNLNTSRSNGSLASMNIPPHAHAHEHRHAHAHEHRHAHAYEHRMNRPIKTTGGYTTRDETEVESFAKSPVKKAIAVQDPKPLRQLVVSFQVGFC
jgi:ABC-type Zn2+ transport system substrate-binding protein/surface adhesin